jgi:hypothetical protein
MEDEMHDIDRTQFDVNPEMESFEYEQYEMPGDMYEALSEQEQMELAAELLEVRDEQELDQFLGNLIRRVGRTLGRVVKSPIGNAIGGVLKGLAKKALPLAGGALGTVVGGPLGTAIGSGLASAAGNALGLEAEAFNQEDREFEGAKQFVRLAANAVQNATSMNATPDPKAAAQVAVAQAAQAHAPGLLQSASSMAPSGRPYAGGVRGHSGRWMRRGNKIILFGV